MWLIRGVSRWAAVMWAVATVTLGVIMVSARASRSAIEAEMVAVLSAPAECAAPCWLGIKPEVTTAGEAIDILEANPWIAEVRTIDGMVTSDRLIQWTWSGAQPAALDSTRQGQAWVRNNLVYLIELPLTARFEMVWSAYGLPDRLYYEAASLRPYTMQRVLSYETPALEFSSVLACPLRVWNFFSATLTARISDLTWTGVISPTLKPQKC
ncbi:MAG: hypothetical protein KF716_11910 [Anaerolineae bacterium]|nr:hypothetical protein [Anaerolineae bacterium]